MKETDCECLIYHESAQLISTVNQVQSEISVQTFPILTRPGYDVPEDTNRPFLRDIDVAKEKRRYATIVHSSGSTGLPKSIGITHDRYTMQYPIGQGNRDFITLPLSVPRSVYLSSDLGTDKSR